jgi:hypothetical protein
MKCGMRVSLYVFVVGVLSQVGCLAAAQERLLVHFAGKASIDPTFPTQVFRIDLDVTGDGVPELLLANTALAGTSGVQGWHVYSKTADERYRYLGVGEFSYLLFRLAADGSGLMAYYKSEIGKGAIVTYRVDATGFHEVSRQEGVVAGSDEWKQFEEWRTQVGLKVLAAQFSDVLGNASPAWTDVIGREPANAPSIFGAIMVE